MPFFWEQKSIGVINITRSVEATMPIFKKHFRDIRKDFNDGQVLTINLVTTHSSKEKMLSENFEYMLSTCGFLKE